MYWRLVLLISLLLCAAANAQVKLELGSATLQVDPRTGEANGVLKVTWGDNDPAPISLRALPVAQGDNYGFVRFNESHTDTIDVDPKAPEASLRDIVALAGLEVFGAPDSPLRRLQGAELD